MMRIGPDLPSESTPWLEICSGHITKIFVSYHGGRRSRINSLQFQYTVNGKLVMSQLIGKHQQGSSFAVVKLEHPSEYLTGVEGEDIKRKVSGLKFTTNNRSYGPFARNVGNPTPTFELHLGKYGNQPGGFYGSFNKQDGSINSIGVYLTLNLTRNLAFTKRKNSSQPSRGFPKKSKVDICDDQIHPDSSVAAAADIFHRFHILFKDVVCKLHSTKTSAPASEESLLHGGVLAHIQSMEAFLQVHSLIPRTSTNVATAAAVPNFAAAKLIRKFQEDPELMKTRLEIANSKVKSLHNMTRILSSEVENLKNAYKQEIHELSKIYEEKLNNSNKDRVAEVTQVRNKMIVRGRDMATESATRGMKDTLLDLVEMNESIDIYGYEELLAGTKWDHKYRITHK